MIPTHHSSPVSCAIRIQLLVWKTLGRLLGVVLLIAATLKSYAFMGGSTFAYSLANQPLFLVMVVLLESALGTLLLFALFPKVVWFLTLLCFAVFAFVSSFEAASGAASCGCFGRIRILPVYTTIFDIVVTLSLLWCRQGVTFAHAARSPKDNLRLSTASFALLIMMFPFALSFGLHNGYSDDENGVTQEGGTIILDSSKWGGRTLPILKHIDIGSEFLVGRWVIILYRSECEHCRRLLPEYLTMVRSLSAQPYASRLAFVELPPFSQPDGDLVGQDAPVAVGRLSNQFEWFAQTPVVIVTSNGKVVAASEGKDVERIDLKRLMLNSSAE